MSKLFVDGYNINSTAAQAIQVDAVKGTATVQFQDFSMYHYKNVSRRAIVKFLMDDARSLGKFINNVLTQQRVSVIGLDWLIDDYTKGLRTFSVVL